MKPFFTPSLTYWCLVDTKIMSADSFFKMAKRLNAKADLVPFSLLQQAKDEGVEIGCILPDMGQKPDGSGPYGPFEPGFNNVDQTQLVYNAIDLALDKAEEFGAKHVIVFCGTDTKEDRKRQFARIRDGFTSLKGGSEQETLLEKARRLKKTFVFEMLNTTGNSATWEGHLGHLGNSTAEIVSEIIEPINDECVRLVVDFYHVVMMGEIIPEIARKFGKYTAYLHFAGVVEGAHDPRVNRGEHYLAGQKIDLAAACKAFSEVVPEGTVLLEEYIPTITDPAKVENVLKGHIATSESLISLKL